MQQAIETIFILEKYKEDHRTQNNKRVQYSNKLLSTPDAPQAAVGTKSLKCYHSRSPYGARILAAHFTATECSHEQCDWGSQKISRSHTTKNLFPDLHSAVGGMTFNNSLVYYSCEVLHKELICHKVRICWR
ncbi:unnamed protein product [Clavelina lepadiformis]|uniref:Uncharacterized protein n=1 Tax=Clavelina lepadiformis TaxID=159417 RepID=A0ABP0FS96_CLALP